MSERKNKRLKQDKKELVEVYEKLKDIQQSVDLTPEMQGEVTHMFSAIGETLYPNIVIQCITEILRITAPKCILKSTELVTYFECILDILSSSEKPSVTTDDSLEYVVIENGEMVIDLTTFIIYRIPSLLKNRPTIFKYIDLFEVTQHKNILREILVILVQENKAKEEIIKKALQSKDKEFIERIFKYISLDLISDECYVKFVADYKIKVPEFRLIKDKNKMRYIEPIMQIYNADASREYVLDKDKRVRKIVAEHVCLDNKDVVYKLIEDNSEEVRISILKRFNFDNLNDVNLYNRFVDRSFGVREEMYRIYKEGVCSMYSIKPSFFESAPVFNNKSKDFNENIFTRCFRKMLDGCTTVHREEFIKILNESNFSLEFLYEHRHSLGLQEYLSTRKVGEFKNIEKTYKGFFLEHLFNGDLTYKEIKDCLENEIFECIKFIKDPSKHFDTLLNIALVHSDLNLVESICNCIKPVLRTKQCIFKNEEKLKESFETNLCEEKFKESESFMKEVGETNPVSFESKNLYFINAHTKCTDSFIEQQHSKYNYYSLYFLIHQYSHMSITDCRIRKALRDVFLDTEHLLRLILYCNKIEYLADHSNRLLRYALPKAAKDNLMSYKNLISSLAYFLCTGLVSIKNPVFFIRAVYASCGCMNRENLKHVFTKYLSSVDQETYDKFYSIAQSLNGYRCTPEENNSKENSSNDSMLKLSHRDKILYYLCEVVSSFRKGVVCEVKLSLESYGFTKLSDEELSKKECNLVVYEN